MKILKPFFASFLLLFIAVAFTTKSQAQTYRYMHYTGAQDGDFVVATGTDAELADSDNWTGIETGTSPDCSSGGKLCQIRLGWTSGTPNLSNNIATILNQVAAYYDQPNNIFTQTTFTVSIPDVNTANPDVTVTILLYFKS